MKTNGELHLFDYKTKQIIATVQQHEYISDLRHWEVKDSVDLLDVTLLESSPYIPLFQQQNIILRETRSGYMVPYVITEKAGDSKAGTVTFYAQGDWTLLDKDDFFAPQKLTSLTATSMLNRALLKTDYEVGIVEVSGSKTLTLDTFMSPLRVIREIRTLWGDCELRYRAEVTGAQIFKRYVDLIVKRGSETAKEIILGKDLNGIVRRENSAELVTALIPFVEGTDENNQRILTTIESVNNGVPYIVDEQAFQRWNMNGKHRFGFYTPQTDDDKMTPTRLLSLAKTELKKRINTSVIYEVDAVDISAVSGFTHEQVAEGDTLRIIDEGFTPTLYLEARAIGGDESHKDVTANKYTFGEYREVGDPNEALRKLYQQMLSQIQDKVPADIFEALKDKVNQQGSIIDNANSKSQEALQESKAAKDIADASLKYAKDNTVEIIEQATPPTANLKDGKTLWSDSSDPNNKVLKLWKGGAWVIVSPDTKALNTALTQVQNDITKAKQDIITGQTNLTNAKTELQGSINTEKQRITDLTTTVNKKVDKTWLDSQLEGKADKSGVYTKEYIDQNTVGKQVYELDKAGNLQKFTDIGTDITRNAEAIKSKAEQSILDNTNKNVTGVTNRVTTVEQTATGLTNRMTSAETKINTATGDISSLQTKTNTIEQTASGSVQKIEELTGRFDGMSIGSVNMIQGTEEIFNNPSATGNYNGFKSTPPPFPKYNIRGKELTISMYLTGKITAKGTNPWLGMEISVQFVDGTATQYLNGRIDTKIELNKDYTSQRFVNTVKVNDKEIKAINVTMGARDLTGSIRLHNGQIEEGNQVTAWKLSPEELTTTQQFTQKTNEIINTVDVNQQKLTAVETKVNNAKYGRDNLLVNSGMFSNTTGWIPNTPANSTMEVVTEDGFNAMKIKGSIRASAPIPLKPDTEYVYSAMIKLPIEQAISEGSGNPLHFWSTVGANPHTAMQRAILEPASKKIIANTWTRVSYKFKTVAGAENTLFTPFMYSQEIINSNAFAYVRYFQLIEGNQITEDWQAPSGDIIKKTNELTQTIDGTISRVSAVENRRTGSDNLLKIDSARWVVAPKNTGSDGDNYNYANLPVNMQMDRTYTVSARVKFIAGTDTHITVYPYPNGAQYNAEIKDGFISHTFKKTNANTVSILLYTGKAGTTRGKGVEFTEIMVTEGDGVVAYAPPSPTIDEYNTKVTTIEQTATGLRTDINSVSNRVTGVEGRATTLETKSNTMQNTLDGNVTDINSLREDVRANGENLFVDSSCENEYPVFNDDNSKLVNGATNQMLADYLRLTCTSYADAFYQIGTSATNNMHGMKVNETFTLSYELQQELAGSQSLIFQHDGTSWSEAEVKTHNNIAWTRVEHTFKVKANTKGIMIRIRFPRVAGANTKSIWLRQLKLERGSLATPWGMSSVEVMKKQNLIKQTTDENSMKLTSIDASGIAGANLVYNTDLLQRPTNSYPDGWAVANTSVTIWQNPWADEPRAGVFRFNRTNLADTDPNNIVNAYSNKFPVARNKDYTWSVWMYVPVANWTAFKVKNAYIMEYYDNAGTRVQYQDVGLTTDEQNSLKAGNWTRITRTFRPTTAGIVTGAFRLALFHNGDIYYRMPQVELGTVATGWNRSTVDFAGNYQFNDLSTRSNEIKHTLDGTVSSVNSISQTVGQHTQQITQQGTTIMQMNNQIDLRVKTTEMTDYIANLGAENELRNTAFETKVIHPATGIITSRTPSLDKWSSNIPAGIGGSIVAEVTRNREGYNSAKIVVTGAGTTDRYTGISQNIPASISSGDYVFGAWFYVQDKATLDNGAVIKLQFFNGATGSTSVQTELAPKLVNNKWVYAEVKVTAPATAITVLRADIWIRRNGTMWVSQPMLQYGSNASAFMEHPQDYVNYDALVGEVAKKVATTDYNAKIQTIESSISQSNQQINLRVLATDVYKKTESDGRYGSKSIVETHESSINLLKNQITLKVEAGGIASAINQTAQAVLIQASKIMLDGYVEAKHLKAQKLVGVTIETAGSGVTTQRLTLNEQNLKIMHGTLARGYFGFIDRTDGLYQPMLQIGGSYVKDNSASVERTLLMSVNQQYGSTLSNIGTLGMAKSMSGNTINYSSWIDFNPVNSTLTLNSDSGTYIKSTQKVEVTGNNGVVITGNGTGRTIEYYSSRHNFRTSQGDLANVFMDFTDSNFPKLGVGNHSFMTNRLSTGYLNLMNGTSHTDYGNLSLAKIDATEVKYTSLVNNSTRDIKTGIRPMEVDALAMVNSLQVREYYMKEDFFNLQNRRMETDETLTLNDIKLYYGLIVDETPDVLVSEGKDGVLPYSIISLNLKATQQLDVKVTDQGTEIASLKAEIEAEKLEKVSIQTELNELKSVLISQEDRIVNLEELLLQQLINKK
ncbi:phage tail spike protein [Bacillus toyonensis]|uniref:phage tail spike protein n=1 Tax=Bacillus toyonensis TaxID=155322 RepID=UPI003D20DC0C